MWLFAVSRLFWFVDDTPDGAGLSSRSQFGHKTFKNITKI